VIRRPSTSRSHGFSLIEMAVVLFIVVLLLGSVLVPFATQVEQRRIAETQKTLEEIKEALIGYAASHGAPGAPFLPCPDLIIAAGGATANDGLEDRDAAGTCLSAEGNLPWVSLGSGAQDAWGNRFHYRVTPAFANAPPASLGFDLNSIGAIRVCSSASPAAGTCPAVATTIPAVVLSFGRNGRGGLSINGNRYPAPASNDERENYGTFMVPAVGAANDFVSRTLTPADAPAGEFDDLVTWLSPNVLFNRMVAAQRLP
jgi:prepilin-type N-terminal cleavage/methylation domain-containing protein